MIINGSLNYDSHGRRRKTVRTKRKSHRSKWTKVGAVAQQGERRTCTAKVAGSIPVSSTNAGKGTKVDNSWKVEISKKYTVAPAYNKGAYQVIPRDDVEHIGK
tara:strand:+ start:708 stop:1016 length:309 start_codon:yes stop_codon:yes gene_type:complete